MESLEYYDNLQTSPEALDKADLEQKIAQANQERGTFRSYDMKQNGEIRTTTSGKDSLFPEAQATFYGRNGEIRPSGSARYSIEMDEAKIYPDRFQASDLQTENALMSEISDNAQAQGVNKLTVWVKDDGGDPQRWILHNFHPTERDPGVSGVFWRKDL